VASHNLLSDTKKRGSSALHSCQPAEEQISSRIDAVPAEGAGQAGKDRLSLAPEVVLTDVSRF
jgi:hypothetical protein